MTLLQSTLIFVLAAHALGDFAPTPSMPSKARMLDGGDDSPSPSPSPDDNKGSSSSLKSTTKAPTPAPTPFNPCAAIPAAAPTTAAPTTVAPTPINPCANIATPVAVPVPVTPAPTTVTPAPVLTTVAVVTSVAMPASSWFEPGATTAAPVAAPATNQLANFGTAIRRKLPPALKKFLGFRQEKYDAKGAGASENAGGSDMVWLAGFALTGMVAAVAVGFKRRRQVRDSRVHLIGDMAGNDGSDVEADLLSNIE